MQNKLKSIKYRLEWIAFRCLALFVRALPVEFASRLSGRLWRLFAPMLTRHKRALAAIAMAFPDQTPQWHKLRVMEMWDNLGRVFAESFQIDRISNQNHIAVENIDAIRQAMDGKTQIVTANMHLGNWEAGAAIGPQIGVRWCGIYQRLHNPLIERDVNAMRAPLYTAGIFPKQQDAARKVMRAMRNGASLGTMGDLRDWTGPRIDFFGKPAPSNIFPALMARTFDIPLFAGMVARIPANGKHVRFVVRLVPIEVPQTSDKQADVLAATHSLQAVYEQLIREYPGQWMWAHKRWG